MEDELLRAIRDRAIARGEAEVRQCYTDYRLDGALAGFAACRDLLSREDFSAAIRRRQEEEYRLRDTVIGSAHEDRHQLIYWSHRWGTLQIEHVAGVLAAARGDSPVFVSKVRELHNILVELGGATR